MTVYFCCSCGKTFTMGPSKDHQQGVCEKCLKKLKESEERL